MYELFKTSINLLTTLDRSMSRMLNKYFTFHVKHMPLAIFPYVAGHFMMLLSPSKLLPDMRLEYKLHLCVCSYCKYTTFLLQKHIMKPHLFLSYFIPKERGQHWNDHVSSYVHQSAVGLEATLFFGDFCAFGVLCLWVPPRAMEINW